MRWISVVALALLVACGGGEETAAVNPGGGSGACPAGYTGLNDPTTRDDDPPPECWACLRDGAAAACGDAYSTSGPMADWAAACSSIEHPECLSCAGPHDDGWSCFDAFGDRDAECYAGYSPECRAAHDAHEACNAQVLAGCLP